MTQNPLLQDFVDNETFPSVSIALPTAGRWYDDDVLVEGIDPLDVPVGVLGVLAEQNYRDPWLVLSGESIPRMLKSVCPAVQKPEELCEVDLEAILLASRLVSYGPIMEVKHPCMAPKTKDKEENEEENKEETGEDEAGESSLCGVENKIIIDLNKHIMRYAPLTDDVVAGYTVQLGFVNQKVYLRPIPYKRVIQLIKDGIQREREISGLDEFSLDEFVGDPEGIARYSKIVDMTTESSIESLVSSIHCVESASGKLVNGKEFIREWIMALPTNEVEKITNRINEQAEKLRKMAEINFTCEECGYENTILLELDAQRLFGQAGVSEMPKRPSRKSKNGGKKKKPSSRVLRP